ncbi:hypothetical protein FOCG_00011 [Fusarium oxysporum f. sp. radicis-lycopersici 26381]|nr:hypothetical protein FOCG_00011 [Fusarium oxysporum f. sp. radicis-lycopersici 26381]
MTPKSLFRKSCKPCRQRHLKCDQTKPKCTNCQKSRHDVRCYYEPKGFRFQRCVVLSEITHSAEPGKENSEEDDSGPAESSQSHQDNPTVDASQHGRIHTDGNDDIEEHDVARSESAPRHSPPVSADTRQASYSPGVSDDIASEHDVVVQPDVCQDHSLVGIPPRSNLPIPIALNEPSVSDLHHVHHVSQVSVTSEAFPSPSHLPLIPSSSLGLSGIANDTEAFILKYYLENAGPWCHELDIVSPTRFFGIHVPQLMIGEPALLSACLAYSSLVLHLHGQVSMQVKDELYERALRQFVPCIAVYREGDGPVHNIGPIHATTVILRMTEQFLELGQDRQHHLHGSSTLFETAHHDWSLLEDTQSSTSFWAYLRGSLRVSFLLEQPCPFELRYLSVWRYASKDPVLTDEARSNLMTYLLAEVCTLCWGDPAAEASTSKLDELRDAILQWREYLPPSFQPWYRNDDEGNVFPDIRFLAPWHCKFLPRRRRHEIFADLLYLLQAWRGSSITQPR